jgi:type IV secretory pathway TrbD component
MEGPRRTPIHLSLTRPLLLAGAERELVLANGTIIAALLFGVGYHWASLTVAGLLATAGHWGLRRAATHEPQLSRIYLRHIRYQDFYPAQAAVQAPPAYVFPSVRD